MIFRIQTQIVVDELDAPAAMRAVNAALDNITEDDGIIGWDAECFPKECDSGDCDHGAASVDDEGYAWCRDHGAAK